jgi:hypothetical protein
MNSPVKRFFAIMAFLAGGISVEIAKPVNCLLITTTQMRGRRNKLRCDDGK